MAASSRAAPRAWTSSPQVWAPIGLRFSGRLSVMRATGPAPSNRIVWYAVIVSSGGAEASLTTRPGGGRRNPGSPPVS